MERESYSFLAGSASCGVTVMAQISSLGQESEPLSPGNLPVHEPSAKIVPAPALLGTLVLKEVHDLVLTLRFTVGTVIALVLAVLAAYIGSLDYNARLDSYQTKLKLNREALSHTTTYSFLFPTLVRPPEPLSVLNHGLEGRVGTDFQVSVDTENTEATGENRGNEYLSIFSEVDLTVIVAVILGLLALLFTFDAVCGEREAGTLKLMASYPVARWQVLLGKYVGAWLALMLPTALACLLSLLVMGFAAHAHVGPQEVVRMALIVLSYVLYLSLMLLVGLAISSFIQRSSIALIFATFFWFFFVTIVPNLATMVPDFVGHRASVYQNAQQGLRQTYREQEQMLSARKDPRDGFSFDYAINNNYASLTGYECRYGDRKYYDRLRDYFSWLVPASLRLAAKRADIWRDYIRYRYRQAAVARALSFLSPTAVFQNTAAFLSGTSAADYTHYIDLATQYRYTFLEYLARKNAFSSWRWFTEDTPERDRSWTKMFLGKSADELTASGAEPGEIANRMIRDPAMWKLVGKIEEDDQRRPDWFLPLGDLPAFQYARVEAGQTLVSAAPEILYLLVLNLILFSLTFMRFVRYDVR
jgi:ABC-type transport system involved in multi-copper enzyme maturation permease subunit